LLIRTVGIERAGQRSASSTSPTTCAVWSCTSDTQRRDSCARTTENLATWNLDQSRRASTGQDCRSSRRQIRITNNGTIPDSRSGVDGGLRLTSNAVLACCAEVGVEWQATSFLGIHTET